MSCNCQKTLNYIYEFSNFLQTQVLESCNWGPISKGKDKERNIPNASLAFRSKSLLSYEPLLSLVMTCLKGQDEQREMFLSSLHSQLSHFIFLPKEDRLYQGEDVRARQAMLEALQLRFSLVGGKATYFNGLFLTLKFQFLLIISRFI